MLITMYHKETCFIIYSYNFYLLFFIVQFVYVTMKHVNISQQALHNTQKCWSVTFYMHGGADLS